ncbi:fructose-1,6-bisphosphatase [Patescibacteria group bacterium]|nr:fructose-1,6-bisphosphatase [Patescibacteria group bacterium]MBU1703680.1 fructose-1,6-bisphosphatase [Patescibacteria group bacterium]MBU1953947.1 fructose-1,6-bisphosphatase [Patescibacteria group bacterium]
MQTFDDFLRQNKVPGDLASVLHYVVSAIVDCLAEFALPAEKKREGYTGESNVSGDRQIELDIVCNEKFIENLTGNSYVAMIASEELAEPIRKRADGEGFVVAFDPLDGSSIAELNMAVGSIIGIYRGNEVIGKTGRDQVAAMIAVYGPELTFLITLGDEGVFEFGYNRLKKEFVLRHANLKLKEDGKIFAPGNIKIVSGESWYMDLIAEMAKNGYALRYSGGMVPDVNQIIRKGGGIYMYPGSKEKPEGKLRLLYECAPIALLIERAGGLAVSPSGDILDIPVREYHQKTPIFLGSLKEVQLALSYVKK